MKEKINILSKARFGSFLRTAALLLLTLLIVGCGSSNDEYVYSGIDNIEPTPAPIKHQISVIYETPNDDKYLPIMQALKQGGLYDELAQALSELFILPRDITLNFAEIGQVNALWMANTNQIVIGYELIDAFSQGMDFDRDDLEASHAAYIDASLLITMHEVGHCFVTLFDLPITGREDDAVDEFATILLSQMQNDSPFSALIKGVKQFYDMAGDPGDPIPESAFADEHSLGQQRFYATLFLAYGSNPTDYDYFVSDGTITPEQASTAVDEYQKKVRVWERLLSPFERPDANL